MTGYHDLDLSGSPDLEAVRRTDELLDRLGRREPGPCDLDDPVPAALAVLAGDVDLSPIPVTDTRQAMTAAGLWPLLAGGTPEANAAERSSEGGLRLAEVGISAPRSTPDGESRWADTSREQLRRRRPRSRSRRSGARVSPQLDHPRVLRIRPTAGIVAAAALVILGGGVSAAVTSDTVNPLTGITAVFGHWPDGRTEAQRKAHAHLTAKVKQAQEDARQGNTTEANKIIAEVRGQIQNLNGDDQKKIKEQISQVQGSLPASAGGAVGVSDLAGTETSADDSASRSSGSANAASVATSTRRSSRSAHGYSRSPASVPTAESSAPSVAGGSSSDQTSSDPTSSVAPPPTRPDRPTRTGPTHHPRVSGSASGPTATSSESSASHTGVTDNSVIPSSDSAALSALTLVTTTAGNDATSPSASSSS
jgi:hypothetical protein